jgi:general secretion pathway protein D
MALLFTGIVSGAPSMVHNGFSPLLLPAYADWQQPADSGKTVDLDLVDADLHVVVATIQHQTGAEIVIQDGAQAYKHVTVQLHDATLPKVLRYVALSAGADVARSDDGVYVFKPAAQQVAYADAPKVNTDNYHYYKLVLQHAVPKEVLYTMGWDQDVRITNPYTDAAPPILTPQQQLNEAKSSIEIMNNGGNDSTAPSVPAARGSVGPSAANRSVDESQNGDQAHQFPGGFGGGYPGGGFPGAGGGAFPGQGFPGPGGFQNNQPGFGARPGGQGGLPEGVDHIYAIQGDNSLLIHATPEAFARIREIVKNLDIAPRQVQIKVEFVTASVNDVDSFGIQYSLIPFPGISTSSTLAGNGGNTSYHINIASGNLVASMEAQLTNGRGKLVQSPIITTTNNVPAEIAFHQYIPVENQNSIVTNGSGAVATSTTYIDAPTQLQVTPRINSDDTVTLLLTPSLSSVSATTPGTAPQVSQQQLQTLRTVHNGETMVLGGLVTKSELNQSTRIPILSDLPIIGSAFRSRNKTVSDSELLIFVTPTIIDDSYGGSAGAGSVTP